MTTHRILRLVGAYTLAAIGYLLLSDWIVLASRPSLWAAYWISVGKGSGFVLLSALALYFVLRQVQELDASRREAEARLQQSEQRYRTLFEQNPHPMWVYDRETRQFLDVNQTALARYGYGRDEFLSMRLEDLHHPEVHAALRHVVAKLAGPLRKPGIWRQKTKDGRWLDVEITTYDLDFGGRAARLVLADDVTERSRAEQQLRASEERLRLALEAASQSIFDMDCRSGKVVVSPAYANLLGDEPTEFEETQEASLARVHPEDRAQVDRVLEDSLSGQLPKFHIECRQCTRTGEWKWVHALGQIVERSADGQPLRLIGILTDITERKQAEAQLRQALVELQRFRAALDHVSACIFIKDRQFRYLYANRATLDFLRLPREKVVGHEDFEFFTAADAARVREVDTQVLRGEPIAHEIELANPSGMGHVFWEIKTPIFDESNSKEVFGLLGISTDITSLKHSEAERQRLMTAIEQSGEIVVITDRDGVIQYVNPAFERVTGYTREESLGRNPRIVKSGKHDESFYQNLWQTITSGETWNGRLVNRRKDGTLYTEEAHISPVFDESGNIVNFVAIKRDITAQLRLEQQFQQSQKLESIGRLAGGVAHDFNNMLTVILGHAEQALMTLSSTDPLHAKFSEIRKAAERSAELTRKLLAFARKQTINPRILDLNEAIEGMLKMLRRLIGEDIELIWKPHAHLPAAKIDPAQVDQILANLCVNARDAIAGVGRITIHTDAVSIGPGDPIRPEYCPPGDYVLLSVSDSGSGIPPEVMEHLFEPFFTTKEPGKGTGLGLSTVYGIVKQNQGYIHVDSAPGEGTTFTIYLPSQGHVAEAEPRETAAPLPSGHGETILLVEDDPVILTLARTLLESLHYRVLIAPTPGAALQIAADSSTPIDLLLTDVVMPEMNGHELAKRLRELRGGMKCLFMSGYTADIIAVRGVLPEGVHFIQKPFSIRDLATRVRQTLDGTPHRA